MKKLLIVPLLMFVLNIQAQTSNSIIFKLKSNHSIQENFEKDIKIGVEKIDAVSKNNNALSIKKLNSGKKSNAQIFVISFPDGSNIQSIINQYKATGLIEYAEPDYTGHAGGYFDTVPNDGYYNRQWGLKNDGTFEAYPATAGADIDMEAAWDIEQGNSDIIVAVMDSGLKMDHQEFEGRIWENFGEIAENLIDDDGNGYVDDLYGWNFAYNNNILADDHGHGTNVTGIIAANGNNSIGYTGVDLNCKIMVLKGLDAQNAGQYSWWHDAIIYATDHGADVINLSVGGNSYSNTLYSAIDYAVDNGVVIVACMMNTNDNTLYYPAAFENVIAVGSTNPDDKRSSPFFWSNTSGSNYGTHISVVAPGNFIYGLNHLSDTDYSTYWGGTSQAAPLVSGLASLLLAQDQSRTPAQIKSIIESTAEDQVGSFLQDMPGFDIYYGYGRINAFQALSVALSNPQYSKDNDLRIYPNPSTGPLFIEVETYPAKSTVYNTLGQKIIEKQITENDNQITIPVAGIYIITVETDKGISSKKVIIR